MKINNFLKRFFPAPRPVERRESERSALSLPIQILAEKEALDATMVEMSEKGARILLREGLASAVRRTVNEHRTIGTHGYVGP